MDFRFSMENQESILAPSFNKASPGFSNIASVFKNPARPPPAPGRRRPARPPARGMAGRACWISMRICRPMDFGFRGRNPAGIQNPFDEWILDSDVDIRAGRNPFDEWILDSGWILTPKSKIHSTNGFSRKSIQKRKRLMDGFSGESIWQMDFGFRLDFQRGIQNPFVEWILDSGRISK